MRRNISFPVLLRTPNSAVKVLQSVEVDAASDNSTDWTAVWYFFLNYGEVATAEEVELFIFFHLVIPVLIPIQCR